MTIGNEITPWLLPIEPMPGESLSHFLGRVRRRNYLSRSALGQLAGIGGVVARWEKFYYNPFPSERELTALGNLLGVDLVTLQSLLPTLGQGMMCEPIRICGACFKESPHHRLEWQFKSVGLCNDHQLRLLSSCPKCGSRFKLPSLWEFDSCNRCGLSFRNMAQYQKLV
jgi:TniQ